jgi:hypothetical protein
MAMAAFTPVLPNQKKTVLQNLPIHLRTLYLVAHTATLLRENKFNVSEN